MKRRLLLLVLAAAALLACDDDTINEPNAGDVEWIPVNMSRRAWYPATAPTIDAAGPVRLADADHQASLWYNIEPELTPRLYDLYPGIDDDVASFLDNFAGFLPGGFPRPKAGHYNRLVPALDIELLDAPEPDMWAGVMLGAGGGADFSEARALAVWVNDFKPSQNDRGGFLHVDVGVLDEDFFEPELDEWNDEDRDKDGFAAAYDDTGLDGLFNAPKPGLRINESEGGVNEDDDVNGDDFDLRRIVGRFLKVNGTEGNLVYDTEDIDDSGNLNDEASFYRFTIPLSSAAEIDVRADYPDYDGWVNEHGYDSWRLYVVDIADAVIYASGGTAPDLSDIRHIRVWVEDLPAVFTVVDDQPGKHRLQVAEFRMLK